MQNILIPPQILYLVVIFTLLLFPKILQRFKIPAPLTCFALGIGVSLYTTEFIHDPTIGLLAILGISSLFLFAGLEVDLHELKKGLGSILGHLLIRALLLLVCIWICMHYFNFSWQVASLLVLAVLTPSTGFIMDSLPSLGLSENERFWVTSKAISGELLALALLFVILKSDSYSSLASASGIILLIAFGLPILLSLLGRYVIPYAPGSEFSLLIMVGLIAAYLTKQIGVYYLVGAFLTGFVARQLRVRMPNLASDVNLHAIKLFASFFVPFYFFYSGMTVPSEALVLDALWLGLIISAILIPLRIGSITLQRVLVQKDNIKTASNVSIALTPTLIFTLVLATILHQRYGISEVLFGALLVYAALTTIIPSYLLVKPVKLDLE
jgi:Kef-type K+ transport system membrane component KefB